MQTSGAACPTPTILSSFPIYAGLLAPGTSATVTVNLNFGSCAPSNRFTATLSYSANGGSATGSRGYALQPP